MTVYKAVSKYDGRPYTVKVYYIECKDDKKLLPEE